MNPQNDYVSIAHTHDASGTYSVFSWDDLTTIANLVRNGHIKTNKFVAFLFTADGTSYAFTISNSSNFLDFFYNPEGLPQGTQVEVNKLMKQQQVYEKYYKPDNPKAKIKVNNADNDADRNAFLQMLRDNNMGLDVFEMDENLENFTKLSLDSNNSNVTEENCN